MCVVTDEAVQDDGGELLRPAAAATLVGRDVRTLGRWSSSGRLAAVTTRGGHRRYRREDLVWALEHPEPRDEPTATNPAPPRPPISVPPIDDGWPIWSRRSWL